MAGRVLVDEAARMTSMYEAGFTTNEVGAALGRSKTTVANVLRRLGVPLDRGRYIRGPDNPNWKGGRYTDPDGYVWVWTPEGHVREHRLVAGAEPGQIVHHKDRDRSNNAPGNLEAFDSHTEHRSEHVAMERAEHGVARHPEPLPGEANPRAKLSEADVLEIRRLRGVESQASLAARYGVSKTAIRHAQKGRNWKCVREFPLEAARG